MKVSGERQNNLPCLGGAVQYCSTAALQRVDKQTKILTKE